MLKIKKQRKDYNNIWFVSDTHFGHNRDFLYEPRGFTSSQKHDEWILNQIDSLSPNDLLIHVGDVGLSIGSQAIIDFMLRFPCETLMVWGNHNSGVYQAYKDHIPPGFERCEIYPLKITPNITMMGSDFVLQVDKDLFYVRHMAPLIWESINKSCKCIIGHSHGNLIGANPTDSGLGKILDVGVENSIKYNGTAFFNINEINEIMSKKSFNPIDHHG
jgi:calcineurin-like phosphoesterase family protein